jgi:hypothetical protein
VSELKRDEKRNISHMMNALSVGSFGVLRSSTASSTETILKIFIAVLHKLLYSATQRII